MSAAEGGRGRRVAGIALSLLAMAWVLRLVGGHALGQVASVLEHADHAWFGAALLLNLTLNTVLRIGRSVAVLEPLPRRDQGPSLGRELAPSLLLIQAANGVLPARAGDALYPLLLSRRHGYSLGALVAAQVVEKANQALSLWMIAVMAVAFTDPPSALKWPLLGFVVIGLVGAAALCWILSRKSQPSGVVAVAQGFVGRWRQGLALLRAPRVWRQALLCSWASDLVDAAMIGLCLAAVGVRVAPGAWLLVLLAINLAIALPSTPGQLGTFEAAAVLVLGGLGVGPVAALAGAVLYHAASVLPPVILGSLAWVLQRPQPVPALDAPVPVLLPLD